MADTEKSPLNSTGKEIRPFSKEEQRLVSDWSARIRRKHAVPENYPHMIARDRINEYINWSESSDFIFVYDDLGTLCKCSYGKITYDLSEPYGRQGDHSKQRVDAWKAGMREKYHVPEAYEIVMIYGPDNNIDKWIAHCECRDAVSATDNVHEGIFWFSKNGRMVYNPTEYEYIYSLSSEYRASENNHDMSQMESDCIAHFLQVTAIVMSSSWFRYHSLYQANMNGDGLIRADMPNLEQTVFALLYMRQLIGSKGNDDLFNTACKNYIRHSANERKADYVEKKRKNWNELLEQKPMRIDLAKIVSSAKMLLAAFQYGSFIIHSPDRVRSKEARDLFNALYQNEKIRVDAVWELNSIMKTLFGEAAQIALLIRNDFAVWIRDKKIPAPNVMWQQNMFQWNPPVEKKERTENQPPQFGVAYNFEIKEVIK